ncbi:MAG: glucose-1-phosphate cytidylyltransferase [Eubacteriales bacterium]|nr:glucose-1-phosphate cytidylyltransferase [Eubacteriales bacterium]
MKVVILAGGFGTRISEESVLVPKPMLEIGGKPILWHIMKGYAHYGYNEFIVCAGYKQEYIKQWFADYYLNAGDVTFDFTGGRHSMKMEKSSVEPWKITIADTGLHTMTGGRIRRIREYVGDEPFMLTYGDAVCDVNIDALVDFHHSHRKTATLTSVIQNQSKGVLDISDVGAVRAFREKNAGDGVAINAGFMVLQPNIFDYLEGDETVFEQVALEVLAEKGELMSYRHNGFWQCMDSLREKQILEKYWESGKAPWKYWD